MTKIQTEVITIKATPQLKEAVASFAIKASLLTENGLPNYSAAARQLIALALDQGDGAVVSKIAFENARAEILQSIGGKLDEVMIYLSNNIRSIK